MSEARSVGTKDAGFDEILLSHLDSAYNLARWVVRTGHDAEDVVQEAYRRAFQYSNGFRGGDARAWLLTIVRNVAYSWLRTMRASPPVDQFDEEMHSGSGQTANPEQLLLRAARTDLVEKALGELPIRSREFLVLRELEGLSYRQIADLMGAPIGTVMSTLSRARQRFRLACQHLLDGHSHHTGSTFQE